MNLIAWLLIGSAASVLLYSYIGYPALLAVLSRLRRTQPTLRPPSDWPTISITVPVYNEEQQIRGTLESILQLDYPVHKRQILVISDASTDRTEEIVSEYAHRGIELLRLPQRGGKGAAENAAALHLHGEIVVNTDASIRIHPGALKALIAQFSDPSIGVASGRDISVARLSDDANIGESGYVGYEMWVRRLETRVGGIIGASGCFYAIRSQLHQAPLPGSLSRDFAAAMIAREHGYRAVSVDKATCLVPRSRSLRYEYRRKVRTVTRGMETLMHKRFLLNPLNYGLFAWMLLSHKICRWLTPWMLVLVGVGLGLLSAALAWAAALLILAGFACLLGALGWALADRSTLSRLLSLPAYFLIGNLSVLHATIRALHGDENSVWEPTRREVIPT